MGLDVHAKLIVGLPMKSVYRIQPLTEKVRKFDPDTGKPIQKETPYNMHMLFDKQIHEKDFNGLEEELEKLSNKLGFHVYDSESHLELDRGNVPDALIGIEVKEMGGRCEGTPYYEVKNTELEKAKELFKEKTGMEAKVYLTMYYSY